MSVTPRYGDLAQRHALEIAETRQRVGTTVRLDEADDDVDALPLQLVRVLEHPVRLADARRRADVHAQPRASFCLGAREQGFRD